MNQMRNLLKFENKKAAIELSVGTIIIIVLGVTMLILGMVLVRGVMCSALGLTGDINSKISSELDKYFEEKGDEVVCIGESGEASITPGGRSFVWCIINAPLEAEYTILTKDYGLTSGDISKNTVGTWIKQREKTWNVAPGDKTPKAAIILDIPSNAPEISLGFSLEVKRKKKGETQSETIMSPEVYFKITRVGFIKSAMC